MQRLVVLTSIILLFGCTSSIKIESSPENADVYLTREGATPALIGKTPLQLSQYTAPGIFSDNVSLSISKEGYQTESLFLPHSILQVEAKWTTALRPLPVQSAAKDRDADMNQVAQGIAEVQRLMFHKNYPEAERSLETMIQKYPNVSVFYDLLGNVHYIQKNFDRALDAYRHSQQIQPNNAETTRMIRKLTEIRGRKAESFGG
jgi:tetratricopeptide (TPR) repeat protein